MFHVEHTHTHQENTSLSYLVGKTSGCQCLSRLRVKQAMLWLPAYLDAPPFLEVNKMKCVRNKTAQNMVRDECTHLRSYSVNFRHLKFDHECTAKWLLFRHQNYREVFLPFCSYRSYRKTPPSPIFHSKPYPSIR